jgi:hypothetical protein
LSPVIALLNSIYFNVIHFVNHFYPLSIQMHINALDGNHSHPNPLKASRSPILCKLAIL